MSNPVFNRLEGEWAAKPGGPSTTQTAPAQPIYDPAAFAQAQQAYYEPAATAVETGRMTWDDVIVKTALNLGTLLVGAAASWYATVVNPQTGMVLMMVGLVAGLILALVNIFSRTVRPPLILAYSLAQGVALGALSSVTEQILPGVVLQAVVATGVVFAVTLLLFSSGKVRNSPKLTKFTLIALLGIIGSRLLIWVLGLLGVPGMQFGGEGINLLGIPLPILISLFAVVVGAICLIQDFDQARVGVEQGVPAKYAWACAFGIMVTVVWLYVEILNILSYVNSR
ncbi:Bax inhibitor-1/YccA family protein [Scrofimicrobium sp. R131]|uniref:Bax inhibitor-1/YccA family protein n=1 Tax=Scrofimicrobium appendicitidis TaxID=3079930 RepID=A0AAU7V8Q8_9ACTO